MSQRIRLATAWLGGCSGCHMSFLDLDEFLIDLADQVDVVFSPLADVKTFPDQVDIALVEGAVANQDNLHLLKQIRQHTSTIIAFGDCAITGNVTAMRNLFGDPAQLIQEIYVQRVETNPRLPTDQTGAPPLLPRVLPIHAVVPVEFYLPGCPPSASRIRAALEQALAGAGVQLTGRALLKFG